IFFPKPVFPICATLCQPMPKPTDSQLKCSILLKSSFYPILFPKKMTLTADTTWNTQIKDAPIFPKEYLVPSNLKQNRQINTAGFTLPK
ncbi:hypothetical protein, partial [Parabacteroides distasonis]|uniref:hypothetical protein n=1 Tax=Parabacteroides distasonis TaxID=823 RepID=UPI00333E329D